MGQIRAPQERRSSSRPSERPEGAGANPEVAKKGKRLKADLDKLLDEIDGILEANAEEFVKNYVQRGGE